MSSTYIDPTAKVQEINLHPDAFKIQVPFTMCISGPTMSGKSSLIKKLIQHRDLMFTETFHRIVYCTPDSLGLRSNTYFDELKSLFPTIELVHGLPSISKLSLDINNSLASLIIVDDLMTEFLDSSEMLSLVSVGTHHHNISCIFVLQSYFFKSKWGKAIQRNATYKLFLMNRMDRREMRNISLEIAPNCPSFMESNFNFLHQKFPPYNQYILVDGHFASKIPALYVRSCIFPDNDDKIIRPIVFFPNPDNK